MKSRIPATLVAGVLYVSLATELQALVIQFDYTYDSSGFFTTNSQAKLILNQAAVAFNGFQDQLAALTPGGGDTWYEQFSNPSGGSTVTVTNPVVQGNTVVVYVGAQALGGALGFGGPGGWGASGSTQWLNTVAARGQSGALATPATDFGPWGGTITFDSSANWYFGTDLAGLGASQSDFLSVCEHELGHVLGFGTSGSWNTYVSGTSFTGPAATAAYGGPVPLDSATDTAHWQQGLMSTVNGTPQEVAMDPALTTGTRKLFTQLDYAGLSDVGWEIPEPATVSLFVLVVGGLLARPRLRA